MSEKTTGRARLFSPIGERADYPIGDAAAIGRDPGNEIVLASNSVAPRQARIVFDARRDGYTLENLSGGSAVKVDGAVVKESVRLRDLNVITLGDRDFIFVKAPGAAASPDFPTAERSPASTEPPQPSGAGTLFAKIKKIAVPEFLSRGQTKATPSAPPSEGTLAQKGGKISLPRLLDSAAADAKSAPAGQPFLIVTRADSQGEYALEEGQCLIGRSEECDIVLEDAAVSRKHALIELKSGEVTIEDLDSVNYTFLEDRRVTSPVPVPPGGSLRFGSVEAKIEWRRSDP